MLRGKPFLAHRMERTRVKGTKVRPKTNPENEPDFYSMPPLDSDLPVPPCEEDEEMEDANRRAPSPSPSVVDTRTAQKKLTSSFPNETVSSTVIPHDNTSSSTSSGSSNQISEMDVDDDDDDQVIIFEGKPFHYLDPFSAIRERSSKPATLVPSHPHECTSSSTAMEPQQKQQQNDSLFSMEEMDAMMERLNEPGGIWSINVNDMDDAEFGTVLENLVINGDSRRYVPV